MATTNRIKTSAQEKPKTINSMAPAIPLAMTRPGGDLMRAGQLGSERKELDGADLHPRLQGRIISCWQWGQLTSQPISSVW